MIEGGLTSIIQECDLFANKPFKGYVRSEYTKWKTTQDVPRGGKYNVPRELLVEWAENSVKNLNQKHRTDGAISKMFAVCGMDPYRSNTDEIFKAHLDSLCSNSIYIKTAELQKALTLG